MARQAINTRSEGNYVHANGADIHYVEAGEGEPLLLLHGGMLSTSPVWAGFPGAYVSRMEAFSAHFRVIAPDTRGHSKSLNPGGGPVSFAQLADDALALIDALGLDRPMLCGFSDGGMIATIVAIREPERVRALVNDAGFDIFNPNAPSLMMLRQMLGGSPTATAADPVAAERAFIAQGMQGFFERIKADHDEAQGAGAWKALFAGLFDRLTTSPGYTFEDLKKIKAPTLILSGDRDFCCSVEDAVTAYRMLSRGELAILPNHGHYVPDSAIEASTEFLRRHAALE